MATPFYDCMTSGQWCNEGDQSPFSQMGLFQGGWTDAIWICSSKSGAFQQIQQWCVRSMHCVCCYMCLVNVWLEGSEFQVTVYRAALTWRARNLLPFRSGQGLAGTTV